MHPVNRAQRPIEPAHRTLQLLYLGGLGLFAGQSIYRAPISTLFSFVNLGLVTGFALFSSHLAGGIPTEDNWQSIGARFSTWIGAPERSLPKMAMLALPLTAGGYYLTYKAPSLGAWLTGWAGGALLVDWSLIQAARLGIESQRRNEALANN